MVTIKTTASDLARAYFAGKLSGCVRVSDLGITSEGRAVRFITITKGSRRVTLTGTIAGRKWEQTYSADSVPLDD
jgi:hypothetical protein